MSESIREVLAREAAEAEARAEAEEHGQVPPMPGQRGRRRAADPSQVYAVRIPASRLQQLRAAAIRLGVQPTVLIRQLVVDYLDDLNISDEGRGGSGIGEEAGVLLNNGVKLGPRRQRAILDDDSGRVRLHALRTLCARSQGPR